MTATGILDSTWTGMTPADAFYWNAPQDNPGIDIPKVCRIRNTLRASTTAVPDSAATLVVRPLAKAPMMSGRRVNIRGAIMGSGSAMESTTWLMTRALVALTPSATTTNAGAMVTRRRTAIGMRKPTNPCMIIWPAMVPTVELEIPEAMRDKRNRADAAPPSSGVNVWYAVSISATSL